MKLTAKEKRLNKEYRELTKFLQRTHLTIGKKNETNETRFDRDYNIYQLEKRREKHDK